MKTLHLGGIAGLGALLAAAPVASAQNYETGWYFNGEAGLNLANDVDFGGGGEAELDAGFRFGAGVGYNLTKNIGVEFDTGWIWNSFSDFDGSLSHIPFLVNGVFRHTFADKWEGFAGGGLGGSYSILCIDDFGVDDSDGDVAFAWQLMAGVRYKFTEAMSLGAGYKYFGTTGGDYDIEGTSIEADNSHNHSFSLLFNWKF